MKYVGKQPVGRNKRRALRRIHNGDGLSDSHALRGNM